MKLGKSATTRPIEAELRARANIHAMTWDYDSETERQYSALGPLIVQVLLGNRILETRYHPMTFHLLGEKYTPDFMHILADGSIAFVEVKGSKKQRGYRDARSKLRAAAALWPCFVWLEAMYNARSCDFSIEWIGKKGS